MKPILKNGEEVVAAWAERASGPGWSNQLVWMCIRTTDGAYRLDAFQPSEWHASPAFCALFSVSAVVAEDMRVAAAALARKRAGVKK